MDAEMLACTGTPRLFLYNEDRKHESDQCHSLFHWSDTIIWDAPCWKQIYSVVSKLSLVEESV